MGKGSHIRAVGRGNAEPRAETPSEDDIPVEGIPQEAEYSHEVADDGFATPRRGGWLLPLTMVLLIAAWTGFFGWSIRREILAAPQLEDWIEWIGTWSLPVILVLAVWLLIQRDTARRASRFTDAAAALSHASAQLEDRLVIVNRELSLAREFLESETRSLETLGRTAAERLSQNAGHLQALVADNGEQLENIATVSVTARENMEKLRDGLPVIAQSAKDVASQIGNAGEKASAGLSALTNGFEKLEHAGDASERRLAQLRNDAEESSTLIRETEEQALAVWQRQVEALRERLEAVLAEIIEIDEQAISSSNEKLSVLFAEAERVDRMLAEGDKAFTRKLEERRARVAEAEDAALSRLAGRLADFDEELSNRRDGQQAHIDAIEASGDGLRTELERLGEQVELIAGRAKGAESDISRSADLLSTTVGNSRDTLDGTSTALSNLTDAAVRLLELIRASADHSREDLPAAIGEFEQRLVDAQARTDGLQAALTEAAASGNRLSEVVGDTETRALAASTNIDRSAERITETMSEQDEALTAHQARLAALDTENREIAAAIREDLSTALEELENRSRAALATIESEQGDRIRGLADRIASQGGEAIDRALADKLTTIMEEFEERSQRAAEASRDAAVQLRDQLAKVNELTGNLESRVAHARAQAEENVDNDFSRRVALITESLNSNAVDIGKALSTEVTDTAWTAYLRGDRGIFTRRAVRLLDKTELREIAELFDTDADFREHVSRYIHDFEGMLRTLLSTRDGRALGVTVLSSDMGKLYVALAQSIERLRE